MILCILDTSVLCELLRVPGKHGAHEAAWAEFERRQAEGERFLLPVTVVLETGNHIAQANDGQKRRACAERFVQLVTRSLDGDTPFTITPVPDPETVRGWLTHFVHDATLGMGVGDRSLIDLAEKQRAIHAHAKVRIWSLDRHLQGYDDAG